MTVQLLTAVAVEAVASNEAGIPAGAQVRVIGNDEAAGSSHWFTGGRAQAGHEPAAAFDGEVIHQVVAEDALLIANTLGKQRRPGIEEDACGFQCARSQDDDAGGGLAMLM